MTKKLLQVNYLNSSKNYIASKKIIYQMQILRNYLTPSRYLIFHCSLEKQFKELNALSVRKKVKYIALIVFASFIMKRKYHRYSYLLSSLLSIMIVKKLKRAQLSLLAYLSRIILQQINVKQFISQNNRFLCLMRNLH